MRKQFLNIYNSTFFKTICLSIYVETLRFKHFGVQTKKARIYSDKGGRPTSESIMVFRYSVQNARTDIHYQNKDKIAVVISTNFYGKAVSLSMRLP